MTFIDYLTIGLSLLLFYPVNSLCLGYPIKQLQHHYVQDIYGLNIKALLNGADAKYYSRWVPCIALTCLGLISYKFNLWSQLDPSEHVRNFILFASFILVWKSVTQDIDIATGNKLFKERGLLLGCLAGLYFSPAFIFMVLFIAINYFRGWHAHMIMLDRVLQIFAAYLTAITILHIVFSLFLSEPLAVSRLSLMFLITVMIVSHYFIPGVTKLKLGTHWYTWAMDNELHRLVVNCYLWGWLKFLPQEKVIAFAKTLKPFDRPLQFYVILFECGSILALMSPYIGEPVLIMAALMHLGVFLLTGILFWEYFLIDVSFWYVLYHLSPIEKDMLFNPLNGILLIAIVLLLPLRSMVWYNPSFSWFDSPFMGRIHWQVVGKSGKVYGLYSRFMNPHEFLYAYVWGFFLIKNKMLHIRIGSQKNERAWREIIASKGDRQKLKDITEKYGINRYDAQLEMIHDHYLVSFFKNLNAGHQKHVCPVWLRSPGDLYYYWGNYESYTGQEPAAKVLITFREEYFDGEEVKTVSDTLVKELKIMDQGNTKDDILAGYKGIL